MEFIEKAKGVDNKKYVIEYLTKYEKLEEINNSIIKSTNDVVNTGYGDLCSGMTIILFDKEQDGILNVYKRILKTQGLNLNDVYITYFKKCNDDVININALLKELEILSNSCFYLIHDINITKDNLNNIQIDFKKFINILDEENIAKEEMVILKRELFKLIEKPLMYTVYKKNSYN